MDAVAHRRAGPVRLEISFRQRTGRLEPGQLRRSFRKVCRLAGLRHGEISVSLVSDAEIRSLNRKYRRVDRSTDVLAFALQEGEGFSNPALLGDVVVSLETAARQARRRRVSLRREVLELFIHGLLHLLGYDHVRSPARALVMRSREKEIRRGLGDGL